MPHRVIERHRQRAIMSRMILAMMGAMSEHYTGVSSYEDLLIGVAVVSGQAEGKPLTPAKIGQFLGMARTTALRRVAAMVESGQLVQDPKTRRVCVPVHVLNDETTIKMNKRLERIVHDACRALSRMDT